MKLFIQIKYLVEIKLLLNNKTTIDFAFIHQTGGIGLCMQNMCIVMNFSNMFMKSVFK